MDSGTVTKGDVKGGWNAAIFIIFVEVAERFAYYGLAGNLITYLSKDLGQPLATAAQNVNLWSGISAIFPLVGAFVADSYLGRFHTILISSVIYLLGLIFLTLSVSVIPPLHRQASFFVALYIVAIGEGGHKPCVQTFAADQFNEEVEEEKMAKSSFFNWWYQGITIGATTAVFVVVYLEDNVSWTVGIGVPAAAVGLASGLFLIGARRYRREGPPGSPFTRIVQVVVSAVRKRRLREALDSRGIYYEDMTVDGSGSWNRTESLTHTPQFRWLDKAAVIDEVDAAGKSRDPWRLCPVNQVEETKSVIQLMPIWVCCLMFAVVQAQMHTFFTKQGSTMDTSIGPSFHFSPASLQGLVGVTILITVPLYDRVFVPLARKITNHPSGITMLQRIGFGLVLSILNMIVSALVEARRVEVARKHGLLGMPKATVPMRVWWLLPQYMLCGASDVFAIVGLQELFYDQMPPIMRSVGAGIYISVVGFGSLLSTAIIPMIKTASGRWGTEWLVDNLNQARLDRYYWVLATMSAINFGGFLLVARGFVYKHRADAKEGVHEIDLGSKPGTKDP
ncbi:hypothetical protein MLD38_011014 [Melastoma candidum]|uniref:Uncharacterized protein n=1 Tax=Melastoma candidum TaxID=119954 RepID=A0ACB9R290_9MYRT|nr:hypothetical protein MLD38_011014 [Melastoma candidum]